MKKLIKLLSKSGIVGIWLVTWVMLVYAVWNLINSVTIQTINKWDQIGSGWFQDVNDKLINVEIYSWAWIASKYMRWNQKVCIEDDCRSNWPSSWSSVWSTWTNKIYYQWGNVGVGTTSPSSVLEVSYGGADNAMFTNTNTGGESWSFLLGDNGLWMNGDFSIGYSDPGNGIAGWDHVNVITLQNNSNVGIWTTRPSYTLQVWESGDGTEARANSWNTFSDKRLKTNLKVLTWALWKIEKLNGYYYNWKTGSDISKQFGTLAQEVEKVLPEIVSQKWDWYKSLNYGKLTPLLIEAFKDLKQEKDKQINKQQKQINDLKKEIEKIKRKLK